jgi:arylsulfatase A
MSNSSIDRRQFLATAAAAASIRPMVGAAMPEKPNVILIVCDDLGYGDTGPYGGIETPNLSRLASEGIRFTNYCAAGAICSFSRAGYMTGRYGMRMGCLGAYFPHHDGIDLSEKTMADVLKPRGYRTMCIGKWHLGDTLKYLPTNRGFDEYYGIPYSVDMTPRVLMHNTQVIEQEADLNALTTSYTEHAIRFIEESRDSPFFLYLPHSMPHVPQGVSDKFRGKTKQGMYGDVVTEIDWSVGQIMATLKRRNLEHNTLLMFSSDHGPWFQGDPGRLRGRKWQTYEGGFRVPFYARFPGFIPAGRVCDGLMSTMDILPTVAKLTGAALPEKPLDGIDVWPMLTGKAPRMEREAILYFHHSKAGMLQCARWGDWKLQMARFAGIGYDDGLGIGGANIYLGRPELYNLADEPTESYEVGKKNPDVIAEIQRRVERLMEGFPANIRQNWTETKNRVATPRNIGEAPLDPTKPRPSWLKG